MNKIPFILLVVALLVFTGCMTRKNTGVAITKGSIEAGPRVAEKAVAADAKMQDATISSAIKMKFANDDLVISCTNHGKVTLNGRVRSQREAGRAMQLARSADGVKSVRSNLVLNSGGVR